MFQFDMSDEQIKEAKQCVRLVKAHLGGVKLYEGLRIGSILLVGRATAMKSAGTNNPMGRGYNEAFRDWKKGFGFPESKEASSFYDHAIICAQHRDLADAIIAELSVKQREEIGVFGLATRVKAKVREMDPSYRKRARVSKTAPLREQMQNLRGEISDLKERVMANEPKALSEVVSAASRFPVEQTARAWADIDRAYATALLEALKTALGDDAE